MAWDGTERREGSNFCSGHLEFSNTLVRIEERLITVDKRINGSINSIEKHILEGSKWRIAIVCAFIGLSSMVVTRIETWATMKKQIEVNTERLNHFENVKFVK